MAHRTQKIKWAVMTVLGVSILGVAWTFYQYRLDRDALIIPLPPKAATKTIMALSQVHQTATKDGHVQWELDAQAAELEADSGKMVLQSPEVIFILEDGTRVKLTAQKGILYTRNNDMEVSGKVRIRNDRYTLSAQALTYEHDRRVLYADSAVHIISEAIDLKAATMRYDLTTNQTIFDGQVEGILYENLAL